jgi:hypothetical protein
VELEPLAARARQRKRLIEGALLLCMVSTRLASAEAPKFDGRGWMVGNQQENARESLTEYVLPGQTVEDWKELVTSTVFYQPVPLDAFVGKIHSSMSDGCPSLVWNVIHKDKKTVVFEWRDAGCGGFEPQNELDRITVEKDGLYRLAYAAKVDGPLAPEKRKTWLAILTQVPLAESLVGERPERGKVGASGSNSQAMTAPKMLSTEQLAAGVRKSGWDCPAGVKSQVQGQVPGPKGALTHWTLKCSNGQQYSVLVDPSGAMTSFQTPK